MFRKSAGTHRISLRMILCENISIKGYRKIEDLLRGLSENNYSLIFIAFSLNFSKKWSPEDLRGSLRSSDGDVSRGPHEDLWNPFFEITEIYQARAQSARALESSLTPQSCL